MIAQHDREPERVNEQPADNGSSQSLGPTRKQILARLVPLVGKGSMDVTDPEMKRVAPYLAQLPTSAASQLDRLVRGAHEALPRVRTPAIVLWGARDAVVPRKAVELAAKRIGSGPARLAVFPRSAHQLALDGEREAVASEVARFFAVFARQEAARQEG